MATTQEAKAWCRAHKNIMTPHIKSVKQARDNPNYFVELAEGTSFSGYGSLYGVTVIKWDNEAQKFTNSPKEYEGLSESFKDLETAKAHFRRVVREIEA